MGYVALIPLLPALAFAVLAPLPRAWRNRLVPLSVAAVFGSLALAAAAFAQVWPGGHEVEPVVAFATAFAHVGDAALPFRIVVDPTGALMALVVTVVGTAVQVYSIGYMHREDRIGWYFAVLSLFTAAMLTLVLADSFLQLFMAWEVMGLCSYLLIGFWHQQEGPRTASIKAFLTTRVGDIGFLLGLLVMYATVGSFDFATVLHGHAWEPKAATAVALLLLFGAMGKSAQLPLHVWLPDAMAGPTPASALIHAATMVAAGVYLVGRALPIFEASGVALTVTLVVGALTALVGGLLAAVQHDIKKVLAYSTISQLGYMFVALGAGGFAAGMYHLVTHAFFKSLLFLGAGVIIHAAHTQDMREMGGLAKHMPVTTAAFGAGALALAGVPPLSGFFSKDEILTVLVHEHQYLALAVALVAAFVTAFYVARLFFRVFTGPPQTEGLREAHVEMLAPMVVLAAITAVIGFAGPAIGEFLGHEIPWPQPGVAALSVGVAVAGLAAGWWVYGRRTMVLNTRPLKERAGALYTALTLKLYFDLTYDHFIVKPYARLAERLARFDLGVIDAVVNGAGRLWRVLSSIGSWFDATVVDGAVNGAAAAVVAGGERARAVQVGRVQAYQALMFGAIVLVMVLLVVKGV
ncbi:NADH-quinone oxidoreductase subunit L [Coriobacteriia bacterium Es71-Z0120]|uniref:NADH-quinone oxidoreductase subunit L n=1 Tax=Parvivirga hydrogeniphila TaxID=2939460 RepID=UPI002260B098|nr:NADH-quinone oxidoreductase subunit L [Parvivirga hydrogeniphila]MCL4079288.1 NADH-quinone oxidoreductase subunit L [Parvivirga hydrogeniphila]